jgi:predicted ATPase
MAVAYGSGTVQLVGRSGELEALERALVDVRAGGSGTIALLGEAGIGKSALLEEVADRAGLSGLLVLAGRAAEHECGVPFGLVVDALDEHAATLNTARIESVGPELGAVLPSAARSGAAPTTPAMGAAERFHYHRALGALLELLGREPSFALLLDDVHWADHASVELILHLLRRPPRVSWSPRATDDFTVPTAQPRTRAVCSSERAS